MADDTGMVVEETESGNPCLEGCISGEIYCSNKCGYNQDCRNKCRAEYDKCVAGCK